MTATATATQILTIGDVIRRNDGKHLVVVALDPTDAEWGAEVRGIVRYGTAGERVARTTYNRPITIGGEWERDTIVANRPELVA